MPAIEFLATTKVYAGETAVAGIDLAIAARRTTVLIGPSGCGKSTCLKLILGLEAPTLGEVRVDSIEVTPATMLTIRRRSGYMIQDGGLFPHLTARANILLPAKAHQSSRDAAEHRLAELCEMTHFAARQLDRYPGELSGGQCQRVALMRALILDPTLLLMDEPLGALDALVRLDLQQELKALFATLGKTVVWITHDLLEAARFADELVLMRAGRIEQRGAMADLVARPASEFVARFVAAQRLEFSA